jgi:hypothetical protein
MSTELAIYKEACRALIAARTTDEVKKIRDSARAMKATAEIANNKELTADAWEIIKRAERRLNGMMAAQLKQRPGEYKRVSAKPVSSSLASAGIDKNLADRARIAGGCHWVAPNL